MNTTTDFIDDNAFNNQMLTLLLKNSPFGIIVCNSNKEILLVNDHISNILDLSFKEMNTKSITDYFYIDSVNGVNPFNEEYLQKDLPFEIPGQFTVECTDKVRDIVELTANVHLINLNHKKCSLFFLREKVSTSRKEGVIKKYNSYMCNLVDHENGIFCHAIKELGDLNKILLREADISVTSRVRLEQALEKEKKINDLKTSFISIASHELRTPLSGILTSASLIERYSNNEVDSKICKHLRIIKSQVRNLNNILNDFLTFDRLKKPEVFINLKMFDFIGFMEEFCEKFFKNNLLRQRVIFSNEDVSSHIYQEPDLLYKIISNILSNALKFSSKDQTVYVKSKIEYDKLIISIEDSGIGIPKEESNLIFDSFYRCRNAAGIPGTGLGLTIAKRCTDIIGGEIEVHSENVEKTIFKIIIPKELNL
jgi:signal transduction histidine kinase